MIDTKEKLAGLLIPVFALRREGDLGIGDTQAVVETIDFCTRANSAVLQVLPINETGGDNSPYNAISSVALDPVLLTLTPELVPGLTAEILTKLAPADKVNKLQRGAVDYPVVKELKLQILQAAFDVFKKQTGSHSAFEQFKKEQGQWLKDYSLFRTLIQIHKNDARWNLWTAEQNTLAKAEKWFSAQPEAIKAAREFFTYVQWVAFTQWHIVRSHADKRGVQLMGDIPFGVSRYSADVWANQELFDLDWSGGAPPETWFQDNLFVAKWGQNWGLPLYHWDKHKDEDFSWWKQRVQKACEIFHYFRIDHVLGFFRIYSFPWQPEENDKFLNLTEEEAKKLTKGRLPHFNPRSDEEEEDAAQNAVDGRALLQMIIDAAGDSGVVAEDLGGMVPKYVGPTLTELGIPGFTIPYWVKTEDEELMPSEDLPELSLATYATHDHTPLKAFYEDLLKRWKGPDGHEAWIDLQRLMRWLKLDDQKPPEEYTEELHRVLINALLDTPCWLTVFMITELLATTERFNMPGTSGESNWSVRLSLTLSEFEQTKPYKARIAEFANMVKDTQRLSRVGQAGTIR